MNVIAISGNITAEPELKTTPDGVSVCAFTVAVRRPNTKDKTDFINCVAWRSSAEFITRYFCKGQKIEVDGCLISRKWEDRNGNKRVSFEVIVNNASFGESKKKDDTGKTLQDGFGDYPVADDEDLPF